MITGSALLHITANTPFQQRAGQIQQVTRVSRAAVSVRRRHVAVEAQKDGYKVLIIGGGAAGMTTASHYARKLPDSQVAVIEPSQAHFYQPLWTLVGGGFKDVKESMRPMAEVMPQGVDWLRTAVAGFDPTTNSVTTTDGKTVKYDYLVVATGIQAKWDRVKGLPQCLGDGHVVSNMNVGTAPLTYKAVQGLTEGHAVFTMPKGVIKCPGAGQKVCYISEDYWRCHGRRPAVKVSLCLAADKVFGIPRYAETIEEVVATRDIDVQLGTHLIEVRGKDREAVFEVLGPGCQPVDHKVIKYDMLHVTPPQGPLDVVAQSELANADGWVDVDAETLQHKRFGNVFALGDCAAVNTSKTAAAAAAEFPVVRDNLDALMDGTAKEQSRYDGYSSCPLVTKKGACMMMEFGYNGQILETFTPLGLVNQQKEEWLMWLVKTEVLPWAYWNLMIKGCVPWSEVKNVIKSLKTRLQQRHSGTATTQ
jgi:sulfide:quinone oxidoreductase